MNYRKVTIHPAESFDAAGTKTIKLVGKDIISRILIKYVITKGVAGHTMAAPLSHDITKIELVDGSDVLFGMTGAEAQALNIYDRKCATMNHAQQMASCAGTSFYGLDFGRYLFDPELGLDPSKFDNLQLKIAYTLVTSDTTCAASSLEVFSDVFDEKIVTPIGFLMAKEHYAYSCGDDGSYEYINLPTDYPVRKMLVRAYTTEKEPDYTIESVRLDEDNLKRIPIDINLKKYIDMMMCEWTPVEELFSCIIFTEASQDREYYFTPTNEFASFAGLGTAPSIGKGQPTSEGWIQGGHIVISSETGGQNMFGIAHGFCPNHCVEFPFGDPMNIADWYDVTKIGNLKLRLESGDSGSSGKGAVILQQLRRY